VTDTTIAMGELSESLGFLLRMAQLQVYEMFYEELNSYQLRPGEFSVMWVILQTEGIGQGALARRLKIKPAHMTKLIQRLESSGYVARIIPDTDRRSVILELTDAGKSFVDAHKTEFFGYFLKDKTGLSDDELETLKTLLQKLSGFAGTP
jgi:DNA-binding MarR family transcriptional regulator